MANFYENDVVQFKETHKWAGCIGYVKEARNDINRYMVGIAVPQQCTAYIYCKAEDFYYIGRAVLVEYEEDENL